MVPITPVSENTSQPVFQKVLPEHCVPAALAAQIVTVCPSLIASPRANCISPSKPLISPEARLALVTYLNDGTPMASRIAATVMVIINSIRVNPDRARYLAAAEHLRVDINNFMESTLAIEAFVKLTGHVASLQSETWFAVALRSIIQRSRAQRIGK